jgi:sterol desaturase/sphingolipid hydroxylase (fatty acid hydroxylase superfamily)
LGLLSLEHSKFAYRADFTFYGVTVTSTAAWLLLKSPHGQGLALLAWVVAGLTAWSFIEYTFHRFLLHGMSPFREWHAVHHDRPMARVSSPTVFSASLMFTLVWLPTWALAGPWRATALTLGVVGGYFAYAITHHATHHWRAQNRWLSDRKRWHAVHHHSAAPRCFGVTGSFWDRVFGTA